MRSSNVYEELSLGVYSDHPQYEDAKRSGGAATHPLLWLRSRLMPPETENSRRYFLKQQLRAQVAHDLWWLVLAVWLIMIIESGKFESSPGDFSVFNVIFEVVSGKCLQQYGTGDIANSTTRIWNSWNIHWISGG